MRGKKNDKTDDKTKSHVQYLISAQNYVLELH